MPYDGYSKGASSEDAVEADPRSVGVNNVGLVWFTPVTKLAVEVRG